MAIKQKLYKIIFEHDTRAGKRFDVYLLWIILFSAVIVMLESVAEIGNEFQNTFYFIEWVLTILFTIEYILRIWVNPRPLSYVFSVWGAIDLLSILPTFISLFVFSSHYLVIVRIFRLLRVFRILKLARFNREAQVLVDALKTSMYKISIFLLTVVAIVIFLGTIMYVVEGGKEGFTNIPLSIYWAIVTVTTVGYGDTVPVTVLGKLVSSIAMIIGYAIIAVPTGIITVAIAKSGIENKICENCNHLTDNTANFCNNCGNRF